MEYAKFPKGARLKLKDGIEVELTCSDQYHGIANVVYPNGKEHNFFWFEDVCDGESVTCDDI